MRRFFQLAPAALWLLTLAAACSPLSALTGARSESGLEITNMVSSLGGESADLEVGLYSYTVVLVNRFNHPVTVRSITPVLSQGFASRLLTPDLEKKIDQIIPSSELIEIQGQLRFDLKDLSKRQIEDMGEPVTGFEVVTQSLLALPSLQ